MDMIRNEYKRRTAYVGQFGENTRGKTEVGWTCTEERYDGYIGRRMPRMELPGKNKLKGLKGGLWMR